MCEYSSYQGENNGKQATGSIACAAVLVVAEPLLCMLAGYRALLSNGLLDQLTEGSPAALLVLSPNMDGQEVRTAQMYSPSCLPWELQP